MSFASSAIIRNTNKDRDSYMARLAGIDLPNKHVYVGLTYIYGIGASSAAAICDKTGIDRNRMLNELAPEEVNDIRRVIESDYVVEGSLRTESSLNIKRLMDIGCYRGIRHRRGLPVRGQRTRTNARGRKGSKRTVAGKKKAPTAK